MIEMTPEILRAIKPCPLCGRWDGSHRRGCLFDAAVSAWEADRKDAVWKRAFDEGEVVGMTSNIANIAEDDNPYSEGSNAYCGWSFGYWSSRHPRELAALQQRLEAAERRWRDTRELVVQLEDDLDGTSFRDRLDNDVHDLDSIQSLFKAFGYRGMRGFAALAHPPEEETSGPRDDSEWSRLPSAMLSIG